MSEREIVVVITGDAPPVAGMSPNGAGIRAWGMAEALRVLGHDAALLFPSECLAGKPLEGEPFVAAMPRAAIAEAPLAWEKGEPFVDCEGEERRVKAIVYQHWGIMSEAVVNDLPKAVDLAGPHLLERRYWGSHEWAVSFADKLSALAQADFALFGSRWQAAWMAPFLATAWLDNNVAFDEKSVLDGLELLSFGEPAPRLGFADFFLPQSIARVAPERYRDQERPVIAYAGAFLPWQNPAWAIRETLAYLDEIGRGELLLLGSPLPSVPMDYDFQALLASLDLHPRVRRMGRAPLDWVASRVAGADAVLDLMAPNPERALASPARAFLYRSLGVPAIRNDYDEYAGQFAGGVEGSGWTIRWEDRDALRAALEEVAAATAGATQRAIDRAARPFDPTPTAQACAGGLARWLEAGAPRLGVAGRPFFRSWGGYNGSDRHMSEYDDTDLAYFASKGDKQAARELELRKTSPRIDSDSSLPVDKAWRLSGEAASLLGLPDRARQAIHDGIAMLYNEGEARRGGRLSGPGKGFVENAWRGVFARCLAPLAAWWAKRQVLALGRRWGADAPKHRAEA